MADFKAVMRFLARSGRRVGITVAGGVVLLAGIVFLFVPGPGLPLIVAGLAILATEYAWARRALNKAREQARRARDRLRERRRREKP